MMTGEPQFDETVYDELVSCFDKFDPLLLASQDAQWLGIMQYASTKGQPGDPWLPCDETSQEQQVICASVAWD